MPTKVHKGKIGRLPFLLREEICERMHNGESGTTLLRWLNALPEVRAILAEKFGGKPVNDANLSEWRKLGYAEWLASRDKTDRIRKLSDFALRLGRACGGTPANAAAAIQGGQILEALEKFDVGDVEDLLKADPKNYVALLKALTAQGQLHLDQQKQHRDDVERFLKWFEDKQAREIAESKAAKTVKMDRLVQLMFGDRPDASAQS